MEVKQLIENDEVLSFRYIRSLDSLLTLAFKSEKVLENFESFSAFANKFGSNGGHIPGRFMGSVIKDSGLLHKHLQEVENPVSFFLTYNEAVKALGKKYPVFSMESIKYLQTLKKKYLKEMNSE